MLNDPCFFPPQSAGGFFSLHRRLSVISELYVCMDDCECLRKKEGGKQREFSRVSAQLSSAIYADLDVKFKDSSDL